MIFSQVLGEILMDFDYIWLCTRENKLKFLEGDKNASFTQKDYQMAGG